MSIVVDSAKLTCVMQAGVSFGTADGMRTCQGRAGQGAIAAAYQRRSRSSLTPPMAVGSNDLGHHHQDLPNAQRKQVSQNMQQQATDRRRGVGMHLGAMRHPLRQLQQFCSLAAATTAATTAATLGQASERRIQGQEPTGSMAVWGGGRECSAL